jgi:DNA-binding response OmpR family regulator
MSAGRILIVDDEQELVKGLQALLELEGFQTLQQSSPLGLAVHLRTFDPDVVLLDVSIPTLSGDRLLRLGRERCFPTTATVILYSGRGAAELAAMAEELGVEGFFSKGDDINDLLFRLPKWVAARRGRQAHATGTRSHAPVVRDETRIDFQPVVVIRTDATSSPTASALQLGGYLVMKASSDALARELIHSCGASLAIIELGMFDAVRCLKSGPFPVPTLLLSSVASSIQRMVPGSNAVFANAGSRDDLVGLVDQLLAQASRVAVI